MMKGWRNENIDELKVELKTHLKIFNDLLKDSYFGGTHVS